MGSLFGVALLAGCATVPNGDPKDPMESMNRSFYAFNNGLDKAILKPISSAYTKALPAGVRESVFNFFSNLGYPTVFVNALLQGKVTQSIEDTARFVFNSTIGIGGLFDVSTGFGLARHKEDFGQTLAVWGIEQGAYLDLPLLGPNTIRSALAIPADSYTSLLTYIGPNSVQFPLEGTEIVDKRARLASAIKLRDESALDPYIFQREAYLQRRRSLIYDGSPPLEGLDEDLNGDDAQ